jgi:hypothetical protein
MLDEISRLHPPRPGVPTRTENPRLCPGVITSLLFSV